MHPTGRLRILETTDLHMHLLGYDYFADCADASLGLAPLADVIATRRTDTCLLFDNGDFLQGTPLADSMITDHPHPLAQAFNTLEYDAVTLGNHEFDYGVAALNRFVSQLDATFVSANVTSSDSARAWQRFDILTRQIPCSDGELRTLRVGVTGFAPPSPTRAEGIEAQSMIAAAKDSIAEIKAAGADVIIALCHAGISGLPDETAVTIAALDGIDVVLTGHTHDRFPDPSGASLAPIDHRKATICGKPAVMAGYHGTSLGEIDLDLSYDQCGWHITGHQVRLHPNGQTGLPRSPARNAITALATPSHQAHLIKMRTPVGSTGQPLHNHFATVSPDPVARLFAKVMRETIATAIDTACPIAAVAPFQSAGAKGQHRRITLEAGVLTQRDVACLYPFNDRLCALRQTGRQLRAWLARSAAHYVQVSSSKEPQALINPNSAGYFCDGLFGLQYRIDLSQPAEAENLDRVTDVRFGDRPIEDDVCFTIATTTFRQQGGGGFPVVPPEDVLWTSSESLKDILAAAIAEGAGQDLTTEDVWSFAAPRGTTLFLDDAVGDATNLPPEWHLNEDGAGYLRHF